MQIFFLKVKLFELSKHVEDECKYWQHFLEFKDERIVFDYLVRIL